MLQLDQNQVKTWFEIELKLCRKYDETTLTKNREKLSQNVLQMDQKWFKTECDKTELKLNKYYTESNKDFLSRKLIFLTVAKVKSYVLLFPYFIKSSSARKKNLPLNGLTVCSKTKQNVIISAMMMKVFGEEWFTFQIICEMPNIGLMMALSFWKLLFAEAHKSFPTW